MTISNAPIGHRAETPTAYTADNTDTRVRTQRGIETKASFKTSEFAVYILTVVGVLLASYLVKATDGHAD
ncbi:MAG: hypothetical protein QOD58_803 [Mycobacterium sp.]|jgi:hypothetical protein|nr:hypothetical protein [Mycobacterium sp.]